MVFGLFGGAKKRAAELYEAAKKGDLAGVRQALDKGADINALDPECSETALHAAVDQSQKAVVDLLLSKGANPDIVSGQHFTPLIIAAAMGDVALPMVESLLAGKANPELAPTTGPNAGGAPMHIAASNGSNAILARLLAAGAKPKVLPNGSTLMHMAAIGGNAETVDIVVKAGLSVDAVDSQSRTPLHLTGITGNSAVARKLIDLGAPLDKRDGEDSTPLMHAAIQNKPNVVDLLIKKGANPDIIVKTNDSVLSPLYGAAINGYDAVVKLLLAAGVSPDKKIGDFPYAADMADQAGHASTASLLRSAAKERKAAAKAEKANMKTEQLLAQLKDSLGELDFQSVIPIKDDKLFTKLPADWRLLVHAFFGEVKGVKDALKDGANPNAILPGVMNGIPSLVAAAGIAKSLDLVDVLLAASADVNLSCSDGKSALMFAAENGNSEIVERLVSAGANVNATLLDDADEQLSGLGAFGLALNRGRINIAKILLRSGARPDFGKVETLPLVILEHGDLELAKAVEAAGVQLVSGDMRGRAAFVSARNPDGEVFDYVLKHGGDVSADNDYKYTALTLAVLNNHAELVERYLARGDDPNAEDADRETALSLAIEKNNKCIIKTLREHGAQVREYPGMSLVLAMLQAARDGALGTILNLRDVGISLNVVDEEGNTPLMLATRAGHLGVVRSLYHLGADIDHRNHAGLSATKIADEMEDANLQATMKEFVTEDSAPAGLGGLHLGGIWDAGNMLFGRMSHPGKQNPPYVDEPEEDPVQQFREKLDQLRELLNNENVAARLSDQGRALIEQMIPEDVENPEDVTEDAIEQIDQLIEKFTEMAESGENENENEENEDDEPASSSPLFSAIESGDLKEIKRIIKQGADIDEINDQGMSALMAAIISGDDSVMNAFIKADADVTYSMSDGKSALFIAIASGNAAAVKSLIKAGAQLDEAYEVEHNGVDVGGCSPLYLAALLGNIEICRLLLKEGADKEACNDGGLNPLMAAIQAGHEDIVSFLIKSGAEVDPVVHSVIDYPPFNRISTPLYIATQKEDVAVIKQLLNAKADVNAQAGNGWTPLKAASYTGNEELVKLFLKSGADVNIADVTNYTPLMNAAGRNHESIVRLLLRAGADPNIQGGECPDDEEWAAGRTALMEAAHRGNLEMTRDLLKHGADPNIINANGFTALHSAVLSGNPNIVDLILRSGADVNAYGNEEGAISAFDIAMKQWADATSGEREAGASAVLDLMLKKGVPSDLSSAASMWISLAQDHGWEVDDYLRSRGFAFDPNQLINGASLIVRVAAGGDQRIGAAMGLLKLGADPNAVSPYGLPVLSLAVRVGSLKMANVLIASGANVLAKSGTGMTAYDLAVNYGYQDITQFLIEQMNLVLPGVNRLDSDGNTALMRAVKAEDIDSVSTQITLGADGSIRDIHGDSPLTYAVCHDLESIISLLRESGSERIATDIQNGDEQLVAAAESGAMGTILDLLDAGVSIETENSDGDTALTAAAGGHPGVLKALAKLGANLNHRNNQEKTAYMIASEANRVAIISALEEIGASVDENDVDDDNDLVNVEADVDELISAVLSGDISTVRQQLAAGIDVNCENDEGRTALIYALAALGRNEIGRREKRDQEQILFMLIDAGVDPNIGPIPPLLIAAQMRKRHIVNALIRLGADVDVKDDDSSMNSLMMAIIPSHEDQEVDEGAALAIIDAGADLAYARDDGLTAAHLAAGCGFVKTLEAIISRLPDCVNVQDGTGNTPLFEAVMNSQLGAIELLLKANADKSIQNSEGETALDIALAEGNQEATTALT